MVNFRKAARNIFYALHRNPVSKILYKFEIERRSKLPFTDIESLSKQINMFAPFTNELQPVNDWYGHAKILKNFLGLPASYQFKSIIEHGLYLSDQIANIELQSNLPTFLTYSRYRVEVLKKYKKNAFAIGPFIHYAPHCLNEEELKTEKKRLGKTLLFFPSHSLIGPATDYNMEWSVKKIKSISRDFKTIRVCLYWKDVLLGTHKYYQKEGFECITAGHILDPLFLPRVKSIIHNADLTVSNDASSPLSYCIFMNKPHIIFYQRPKINKDTNLNKIMTDYWKSEPYNMILKEFSKIKFSISLKQRKLMNYYCGTDQVKSKKELMKIINKTEDIFKAEYEKTN